jgi:hypothetical protein
MAKVPFSKLQAVVNGSDCTASYYNKAGEEITFEVKQYLPLAEKVTMMERIVNQSVDDNGFYNPMRVKLFMVLEVMYAYTNLSFTDKMKEDPFKLYDMVVSTGIFADVISRIHENEWAEIQENVWATIKNIYDFRNSAMGILSFIASDYSEVEMDASNIQSMLSDPANLDLLKQVITRLG